MYAGRKRYAQLVRLYMYDRNHVEKDGEPLGYVRIITTRSKGESYNIFAAIAALQEQMQVGNWIGASDMPKAAYRILPNMYLYTAPAVQRIYNFTVIYKHNASHLYYVHNIVHNSADIPSRKEMLHNTQGLFNTGVQPITAELFQIQHCLCDSWANVGTEIYPQFTLWLHLKRMNVNKFAMPQGVHRELNEILDDGDPGDSYLRTKLL